MHVIQQNPHQLGDRHRGMSVVKLNRDFLRELAPIRVGASETPDQIGQRAGDQEVFLYEAQALSHARRIVRIKYACKRLSFESLGYGAHEVAMAECLKIKEIGRSGGP